MSKHDRTTFTFDDLCALRDEKRDLGLVKNMTTNRYTTRLAGFPQPEAQRVQPRPSDGMNSRQRRDSRRGRGMTDLSE